MDPNDQNPMGPTDTPQGPGPDDGQGVPTGQDVPQVPVPPMPPSLPPTGEGQEEGKLPPPPPVEPPSGVPAGDDGSPQTT